MRERGKRLAGQAAGLRRAPKAGCPATRPSPRPPVAAARQLSSPKIQKLVRDPYAIYARHVLKLRPLDPLRPVADPRLRGTVLHEILEVFLRAVAAGAALMSIADRGAGRPGRLAPGAHDLAGRIAKAAPGLPGLLRRDRRQAGADRRRGAVRCPGWTSP
jgi:hypothetical protein